MSIDEKHIIRIVLIHGIIIVINGNTYVLVNGVSNRRPNIDMNNESRKNSTCGSSFTDFLYLVPILCSSTL